MADVFVSYKHEDGDFAAVLRQELEKADFIVWTDDQLPAGADWRQTIDDAIREAIALIVVMTPEARESEYVTYEWAFAWGQGIEVIPIVLKPTQLHPRLEAFQYLDFTNRNARPWNKLIERLQNVENAHSFSNISFLRKSLKDKQSSVTRRIAAEKLGEKGDTSVISDLVEVLNLDKDSPVRQAIADALGKLADPIAIPALIEALCDEDNKVRQSASFALQGIGGPAVPNLLSALSHEDSEVRKEVAHILRYIGDSSAISGLVQTLHDWNSDVRWAAMWALQELGKRAVPNLIEALGHEDSRVREAAAETLREIKSSDSIPDLIKALHDRNPRVRDAATRALGEMGTPAVTGLIDALQDDSTDVRYAAATALSEIRNSSAVPALIELLNDNSQSFWTRNRRVCDSASDALASIGTINAIEALEAWWRREQGEQKA